MVAEWTRSDKPRPRRLQGKVIFASVQVGQVTDPKTGMKHFVKTKVATAKAIVPIERKRFKGISSRQRKKLAKAARATLAASTSEKKPTPSSAS